MKHELLQPEAATPSDRQAPTSLIPRNTSELPPLDPSGAVIPVLQPSLSSEYCIATYPTPPLSSRSFGDPATMAAGLKTIIALSFVRPHAA